MRSIVAIQKIHPRQLDNDIREILGTSGCRDLPKPGMKVVIKPNLVTDKADYIQRGANTSVEVLEEILVWLSDCGCEVLIGESETGTKVKGRRLDITWKLMGLDSLAKKYGAELVNFTEQPTQTVKLSGRGYPTMDLPCCVMECDLIINLPKIKTHKYAVVTCAMKNLFGLIPNPRRIIYHHYLAQTIADLTELLMPRMVTVVDGIIGMEGNGPLYGTPVELNLLLAGRNPVSIDRTVCNLIGIQPEKVPYLLLAKEMGLWMDILELMDQPKEEYQHPFKPVDFNFYRWMEMKLMESPLVHVIVSDWFQRHVSRHLRRYTERFRGGGYSWYLDSPEPKKDDD